MQVSEVKNVSVFAVIHDGEGGEIESQASRLDLAQVTGGNPHAREVRPFRLQGTVSMEKAIFLGFFGFFFFCLFV